MPKCFGNAKYILQVTRINKIHEKIKTISDELEKLVEIYPEYICFLDNPR